MANPELRGAEPHSEPKFNPKFDAQIYQNALEHLTKIDGANGPNSPEAGNDLPTLHESIKRAKEATSKMSELTSGRLAQSMINLPNGAFEKVNSAINIQRYPINTSGSFVAEAPIRMESGAVPSSSGPVEIGGPIASDALEKKPLPLQENGKPAPTFTYSRDSWDTYKNIPKKPGVQSRPESVVTASVEKPGVPVSQPEAQSAVLASAPREDKNVTSEIINTLQLSDEVSNALRNGAFSVEKGPYDLSILDKNGKELAKVGTSRQNTKEVVEQKINEVVTKLLHPNARREAEAQNDNTQDARREQEAAKKAVEQAGYERLNIKGLDIKVSPQDMQQVKEKGITFNVVGKGMSPNIQVLDRNGNTLGEPVSSIDQDKGKKIMSIVNQTQNPTTTPDASVPASQERADNNVISGGAAQAAPGNYVRQGANSLNNLNNQGNGIKGRINVDVTGGRNSVTGKGAQNSFGAIGG